MAEDVTVPGAETSIKVEEKPQPKTMEDLLKLAKEETLASLQKKGVTPEMISAWRQSYRRIAAIGIGDDDICVIRPLTRKEWKDFASRDAAKDQEQNPVLVELEKEERIAARCVLFPKPDEIALRSVELAGMPTTVALAVMNLSGFPQSAPQPLVL